MWNKGFSKFSSDSFSVEEKRDIQIREEKRKFDDKERRQEKQREMERQRKEQEKSDRTFDNFLRSIF